MAQTDQVYLPERLLARLDDVRNHRLTLIEAPSGFGKTTSFREYLRGRSEARCFWYTCLGETRTRAWKGVCDLALAGEYTAIPDLLELTQGATDPVALQAEIKQLVQQAQGSARPAQ